jgi:hypothetical protein
MSLSSLRGSKPISEDEKRQATDKGNPELSFWDTAYPIRYSGAWCSLTRLAYRSLPLVAAFY